jgi:beta-galactosidase
MSRPYTGISRRQFLRLSGASVSLAMPLARRCVALRSRSSSTYELPAAYWIGAAYYPEQLAEREWEEDFQKMAALGINVVRMAEFAWSRLQTLPGRYDFAWLDKAIELASAHKISVLLGVPTAAVPPWLYRLHPDVLGGNEHGAYSYGGRKGFSVHSPAMKLAAKKLIGAMAERYGSNAAVVGWQLSNEPGFPFSAYDAHGLRAFRVWLKGHYGTLEALNDAWGGNFWSNHYDQWDEIQFPVNVAEAGFYPAVRLDYRRFFSDSYVKWLRFEAQTLRDNGAVAMAFVNWPDTQWSVDIYATEGFVGATGWDNYGKIADDRDYHSQYYSAMNHDFCRCSRADHRFFVVEQRSQAPATSSPAAVRLQTFADFAHGSFGTVYFEWKAPVAGGERGYVSMLDRDGQLGPSAVEIQRVGTEFQQLWKELRTATTRSKVAMIFSYDNQWDNGFGERDEKTKVFSYDEDFARFYAGAKALGQNVDVISTDAPLEGYRLLIAPGLQMVSDDLAARLNAFVKAGGCLILNQATGTRDATGRERRIAEPGVFSAIAGISVENTSRVDGEVSKYLISFGDQGTQYSVLHSMEKVVVSSAAVMAFVTRPEEMPLPAITVNVAGYGRVIYFSASSTELSFYEDVFRRIQRIVGLTPILNVPSGMEVVSRVAGGVEYIFLQNFLPTAQKVSLEHGYRDALTGVSYRRVVDMDGFDVKVLVIES